MRAALSRYKTSKRRCTASVWSSAPTPPPTFTLAGARSTCRNSALTTSAILWQPRGACPREYGTCGRRPGQSMHSAALVSAERSRKRQDGAMYEGEQSSMACVAEVAALRGEGGVCLLTA